MAQDAYSRARVGFVLVEVVAQENVESGLVDGVACCFAYLGRCRPFDGADLSGANFYRADLRGSTFEDANLTNTGFTQADLRLASRAGADGQSNWDGAATGSRFRGARLVGTNLAKSKLRDADFHGAALNDTDLSGAELNRANFQGADLDGAKLTGAHLMGGAITAVKGEDRVATLEGSGDWSFLRFPYDLEPGEGQLEVPSVRLAGGAVEPVSVDEVANGALAEYAVVPADEDGPDPSQDAPLLTPESVLPDLTRRQRQALLLASELGYYELPRKTTTEEIAEKLGITRRTVEEHLRRGEKKVMDGFIGQI